VFGVPRVGCLAFGGSVLLLLFRVSTGVFCISLSFVVVCGWCCLLLS
jgi:hypothetical protein